jgi:hypothetical protein
MKQMANIPIKYQKESGQIVIRFFVDKQTNEEMKYACRKIKSFQYDFMYEALADKVNERKSHLDITLNNIDIEKRNIAKQFYIKYDLWRKIKIICVQENIMIRDFVFDAIREKIEIVKKMG